MEKVQISAILNSVDKTSSVSIMFDITDNISFGVCGDSIVFTSSSRELTEKYTRLVLTKYRIFGGEPVIQCTYDKSTEIFGIYQTTITVK